LLLPLPVLLEMDPPHPALGLRHLRLVVREGGGSLLDEESLQVDLGRKLLLLQDLLVAHLLEALRLLWRGILLLRHPRGCGGVSRDGARCARSSPTAVRPTGTRRPRKDGAWQVQAAVPSAPGLVAAVRITSHAVMDGGGRGEDEHL
jgi:hypothetical protein